MLLKQSTARNRMILMVDSVDHVTGKTGLTLTITASKDGAPFAGISPSVTERGTGWYNLDLTTSHTDTLGDLALHITGSGADPTDVVDQVVLELPGGTVTVSTASVNAIADQVWDEVASGHTTVGSTGQLLDAASAAGTTPTVAQIADGVWDELRAGHVTAGSFGHGVASVQGNVTGSVASVTAKVTPVDVDGETYDKLMKVLRGVLANVAVPSGSDVIFKLRDGTTTIHTITYGATPGQRTGAATA